MPSPDLIRDITGVILAGGKSLRYGKDKAFESINGIPLIEKVIEVMKGIFYEVILITNSSNRYSHLGLKTYEDIIKDIGPIGGIFTGLVRMKNKAGFFVACDMPFLNSQLIRYMVKEKGGFDVVIPRIDGYIEPLHAIYTKKCISFIKDSISSKRLSVREFFDKVSVRYVEKEEILRWDPKLRSFININRPEDLRRLQNKC